MKEKKIGKVIHYFSKIKVAVIKFSVPVSVGDSIRIEGGENTNLKMKIFSMEVDGEKIKKAKKNQKVGVKVNSKVRAGYKVFNNNK